MGFETTIPAFEGTKTVHALDRVTTVTGTQGHYLLNNLKDLERCTYSILLKKISDKVSRGFVSRKLGLYCIVL
jgi:hypothetical protein